MPNGRCRPSAFGIKTRLEGSARYAPRCTRLCRSTSRSSNPASYSCHVTPSTPGEACRFKAKKLSPSRPTLRWWSRAVNRSCFLSFATCRTPFNPWDIRFPLCVGGMLDGTMFSSVCALPSPTSVEGCPSLFGWFIGTTAVRLLLNVHVRRSVYGLRGPILLCEPRRPEALSVLVHVVSQRARVLRLRRTEQSTRV